MAKCKWRLLRKLRSSNYINDSEMINDFRRLRSELKCDIKRAQRHYLLDMESNIKSDPKKFWAYVNSLRKCTGIPAQMTYSGELLNSPEQIVNAFSAYFTNNYSDCAVTNIDDFFDTTPNVSISLSIISESEVLGALKKLKSNLTAGHDGIPAFLLSDYASVLCYPLTIIFNTLGSIR